MSTILSIDELLQRVGVQPEDGNDWFVLTLPFEHHGALAEDLADVLEIFTESSVGSLSGQFAGVGGSGRSFARSAVARIRSTILEAAKSLLRSRMLQDGYRSHDYFAG
jgi:hypothetical protein